MKVHVLLIYLGWTPNAGGPATLASFDQLGKCESAMHRFMFETKDGRYSIRQAHCIAVETNSRITRTTEQQKIKGIKMDVSALGITKDEVISMVVDKIVREMYDDDTGDMLRSIEDSINKKINKAVTETIGTNLNQKVDAVLDREMAKVLNDFVTPVTIWGEKNGEPTTIKALLSERAKKFWEVSVDKDGKETSYGGEPRHQRLMKQFMSEEFTKAIKQNATDIVAAFATAIKVDLARVTTQHIDNLIKVNSR